MSQAAAVPQSSAERLRGWMTPLNLHFAGVGLLGLICLYLLIHMGFAWQAERSQDAAAVALQTAQMRAAEQAAEPLRGLDGKLTQATANADDFYNRRLPYADSQMIAEVGALAKKQGLKLTRVQYAPSPVLEGAVGEVTEMRLDASLSGEYRPLVQFINSLERDRMFFFISSVTLTGQQNGNVNLRMKLTTYLRAPLAGEGTGKVVAAGERGGRNEDEGGYGGQEEARHPARRGGGGAWGGVLFVLGAEYAGRASTRRGGGDDAGSGEGDDCEEAVAATRECGGSGS